MRAAKAERVARAEAGGVSQSEHRINRRALLASGGLLLGSTGLIALGLQLRAEARQDLERSLPFDPQDSLRRFERGRLISDNGRTIRLFEVEARSITVPLTSGVLFKAWTLNGRIPGPTLRATEGERIRVVFRNADSTSHSLHFHGIHPAVVRHVGKGLFGLLVVDPPTPRSPADELVLVMGGYDLNNDDRNELYAFNGIPDAYKHEPIRIKQNAPLRIYLLNMTELEGPLTFHVHANEFRVIRPGVSETTDVITLGVAERRILELSFPYPGMYMFHPHQDQIAERGCMGHFEVVSA
jgi:FtsP/CotA-like multicopper oxidase with cupredoxin domain